MKQFLKLKILFVLLLSLLLFNGNVSHSETPLTYIAIGDSITAGLGASEVNYLRIGAYVPSFVTYLREVENKAVHVENHAIPGITTRGLIRNITFSNGLQNRIQNSNFITLTIGGNDLLQHIRNEQQLTLIEAKEKVDTLEQDLEELNTLLRSLNPTAPVYYIGLYNPYPNNHQYHELASIIIPMYNDKLATFNKGNTHIINPYDSFKNKQLSYTHINKSDIHPTDKGYKEIVSLLINEYVKNKK